LYFFQPAEKYLNKEKQDMFEAKEQNLEGIAHVEQIAGKLRSKECMEVMMSESMGGNAGHNRLAVNALADCRTGELAAFGNPQTMDRQLRENPRYALVTFLYDMGDVVARFRGQKGAPEGFVEVRFGQPLAPEAEANLKQAVERLKGNLSS
jgi:hypothetical protein